jgi:hypothetical protein
MVCTGVKMLAIFVYLSALSWQTCAMRDGAVAASSARPARIPLQKQYVPVMKGERIIAYKTAYFGEIQAGSPSQTFTVVFDTGSGHVILPKSSCGDEACSKHRRYDRASSTTAVDIKFDGSLLKPNEKERDQVVVSFGTGKVTGEFIQDVVCAGGGAEETAECVQMRMVLAVHMTEDPFSHFAFDGVMGLGLNALRLNDKFSFFGEMIAQNPNLLPQFSVYLSRQEDGSSMLTFGGHDEEKATTEIQWAPIAMADLGFWQVQIKQVRIGDTILDECANGACRAILDTGTSLLGVPRDASRSMHRHLARPASADGKDAGEIDCRKVPGYSIDFDLGDIVVSLPVEDYSRPAPINMTNANNSTSLVCRSLLLPIDLPPPVGPMAFVWGEPVLRRYLTIYDIAKKQIGFSLAKHAEHVSGEVKSIGAPAEGSLLAGAPLPGAVTAGGSKAARPADKTSETVVKV